MYNPIVFIFAFVVVGCCLVLLVRVVRKPKTEKTDETKETSEALTALKKVEIETIPLRGPIPIATPTKPGTVETQGTIESLEEFQIDQKIAIEFTRIKEGTAKRIVIGKGTVQIRANRGIGDVGKYLFFVTPKRAYWVNPKKIISVVETTGRRKKTTTTTYKLVYDILYSEPLNQDGSIDFDDELEMVLADSGMDQYVTIAAYEGGFQFTPTLKRVMLLLGVLGFIAGLSINGSAHLVPTTIIHWVP